MKRMIRIVALLMAALMVVTSCQAPDSGRQLTDGTVDVSFAGPSARTITTDDGLVQTVTTSNLWFQYKAVWEGSGEAPDTAKNAWTNLGGPGLTDTIKLHRGRWNLSLRAYVNQSDVGEDDKFILSGTKGGVEIGTNNMVTQTVSISLGYVRQEGDGTLHVSATYPVVYHEVANPGDSPVEAVRKVKVTANVADTDYTGEITTFDSNNVGTLDLTVPAGAAHVTVQYYMDDSTLFEDDKASKDVLIMATMTTNLAVSVDRDITAVTFTAVQPEGSVEDNYVILHSIFDVFPDTATTTDCIVGYSIPGPSGSRSLGETITFPYAMEIPNAQKNEKGQYLASEIGFEPIVKTAAEMINEGYLDAWIGPNAWSIIDEEINNIAIEKRVLKEVHFTGSSTTNPDGTEIPEENRTFGNGVVVNRFVWPVFQDFVNLEKVVLPDDVEGLFMGTFMGCMSLKDINLPPSLKLVGPYVFSNCFSWTDRQINSNIATFSSGAWDPFTGPMTTTGIMGDPDDPNDVFFKKLNELKSQKGDNYLDWEYNYTFGPNVTKLGRIVNENAKTFVIPEGIEELEETFAGCELLESIQFPSTLKVIGDDTFSCCESLRQLEIPEGVQELGRSIVTACINLETVTIPSTVRKFNSDPFAKSYEETFPGNVVYNGTKEQWHQIEGSHLIKTKDVECSDGKAVYRYDSKVFNGLTPYGKTLGLTEVVVPDGIERIEDRAFQSYYSEDQAYKLLESISLPNSVTYIGPDAFYACSGLKSITIPDNVTTIGNEAFYKCTGLTSVTIGSGVTSISSSTFSGCNKLKNIYVNQAENNTLFANGSVPSGCRIHWNSTGPEATGSV